MEFIYQIRLNTPFYTPKSIERIVATNVNDANKIINNLFPSPLYVRKLLKSYKALE